MFSVLPNVYSVLCTSKSEIFFLRGEEGRKPERVLLRPVQGEQLVKQLAGQHVVSLFKLAQVGLNLARQLVRIEMTQVTEILEDVKQVRVLIRLEGKFLQLDIADVAVRKARSKIKVAGEGEEQRLEHAQPDLIGEIHLDGVE